MIRQVAVIALLFAPIVLLAACGSNGESGAAGSGEADESSPALPPDVADMTPTVVLETTKGRIVLELDRGSAPQSVANILEHVQAGFYDGLIFHRVIPGFMIQGGGFTPEMNQLRTPRSPVPNEADNGLRNQRGTIAMARTNDPHSATSQFFINLVDNLRLDHTEKTPRGWGYTVFGRVVEGMDVVDAIAAVPTTTRGPYENVPSEPVIIQRAYLADESAAAS